MKAVVLAGGQDVSRCPLSMVRPRPLFPLVTGVLLDDVLRTLHSAGVCEAIVCANGKTRVLREHFLNSPIQRMGLGFHDEGLPLGTAGCLRDVADRLGDQAFLVIEGGLFVDGDLGGLVDDHRKSGAALTVGAVPVHEWSGGDGTGEDGGQLSPMGTYVVDPAAVQHVPANSYFDIKEQLIPRLRDKRLRVRAWRYRGRHRRIGDARAYFVLIQEMLVGALGRRLFDGLKETAPQVWVAEDASVDASATLVGPIAVGSRSVIGQDAVVTGPALIGEGVVVGERAFVSHSVLWPGAQIGYGASVVHAIVTDSFRVRRSARVAHCVAVDRDLRLGDVHGLRLGGYAVESQDSLGLSVAAAASTRSALSRLWQGLMAMRHGDEIPLTKAGGDSTAAPAQEQQKR